MKSFILTLECVRVHVCVCAVKILSSYNLHCDFLQAATRFPKCQVDNPFVINGTSDRCTEAPIMMLTSCVFEALLPVYSAPTDQAPAPQGSTRKRFLPGET